MKETKYKMTDVGLMPHDWKVAAISSMSTVSSGGTPSTTEPTYWNGDIPWMNSGELNLKYVSNVENRITEKGLRSSSTHWIPQECVLIGLAGQGKTRGTAAFNLFPLCTNQSIGAIYPCESFHSRYVYYYMDSQYLNLRALSDGGGGRGGLTKKLLEEYQIPLPPLSEQSRIASALSSIDNLLSSLDKLIAKKQAIKQGTMQQLLSGKTRLKGFNEPWVEKKFGDMGYTYSGLSGKGKSDFGIGDARYITFLNVLNNVYINTSILENVDVKRGESQNAVMKGDLFFNTSSETPEEVGFCAVLNDSVKNVYLNSFCFGFRISDKNIYPAYIAYLMRSSVGRQFMSSLAQGVTRYNLSKAKFCEAEILVPASREEQRAIASVLTSMDNELAALTAKKQKYEQIKQGMMQQLLTGKIRLI